jgi:hypothetical protein
LVRRRQGGHGLEHPLGFAHRWAPPLVFHGATVRPPGEDDRVRKASIAISAESHRFRKVGLETAAGPARKEKAPALTAVPELLRGSQRRLELRLSPYAAARLRSAGFRNSTRKVFQDESAESFCSVFSRVAGDHFIERA